MTEQSLSQLEQDAERVRAKLADTTEHLKKKMSPGQLIDEVVNYFKDGDTSQTIGILKHQIRDNPMALAVIGSGLAWLMMGSGSSTYGCTTAHSGSLSEGPVSQSSKNLSGLSSTVSQVAAQVGSATESATETVSSIADSVSATLHDIRDTAQESFTHAATAGEEIGAQVKTTVLMFWTVSL